MAGPNLSPSLIVVGVDGHPLPTRCEFGSKRGEERGSALNLEHNEKEGEQTFKASNNQRRHANLLDRPRSCNPTLQPKPFEKPAHGVVSNYRQPHAGAEP